MSGLFLPVNDRLYGNRSVFGVFLEIEKPSQVNRDGFFRDIVPEIFSSKY